ncbi:hypothetical protein [Polaromonas sp. SM01]|uniref:hypothetical protein n=1 Tax=Polaromonas sp. SM01 TaxID=3085630 RepID=UPI002981ED47|nr:hypothetical protein [Polaromonas sp. SM01]MDW5443152.1 hypothetical protein [Polaromonas sp. SM01]
MTSHTRSQAIGLVLLFALATPVLAQTAVTKDSVNTAPSSGAAFATPVDPAVLDTLRGGSQLVRNDMTLTGTTADNTARNVTTGTNAISTGAFANMSGLPVVIQNSGANVLIQSAVILHLQMN